MYETNDTNEKENLNNKKSSIKNIIRGIVKITGVVQGVGFRPFVYNLAVSLGLNGWVNNFPGGVNIEVEGQRETIDIFMKKLFENAPPLSKIEDIDFEISEFVGYSGFRIQDSENSGKQNVYVSPDVSICENCRDELFAPSNYRYMYPFINCTNCGPRFTITTGIPYDRDNTTMRNFQMCEKCKTEYNNPADRRFHAQPIACEKCGPKLRLLDTQRNTIKNLIKTTEIVNEAKKLIKAGCIIAVKGLGGYHLACDAKNKDAVYTLRKRKKRDAKPFALMFKNLEIVRNYCELNDVQKNLLTSIKKPIILLKRKDENQLPYKVISADNDKIGVMLPYTPLHEMLFDDYLEVLVMTSANLADHPIFYSDEKAFSGLSRVADYFLTHDRPIYIRTDDSVTSVFNGKEYIIRRSRGYVPLPVSFPTLIKNTGISCKPSYNSVLSCGAELKNTFAITKGSKIFMSHHIGDLTNVETYKSYIEGISHFKRIFSVEPRIISYDKHPLYLSSKYALEQENVLHVQVQHHHAHIASCMVDNNLSGKVIGVAFDGTGFGEDSNIWGGEFLLSDYNGFERKAYFEYMPLPGGDKAVKYPWRTALGYLSKYGINVKPFVDALIQKGEVSEETIYLVFQQMEKNINTPLTSSAGRLFDAVSAVCGFYCGVGYEGQAAIKFESVADLDVKEYYPVEILNDKNTYVISFKKLFESIFLDINKNLDISIISGKFHNSLSKLIVDVCSLIRYDTGINDVVLSGGVFQNMLLLNRAFAGLEQEGFNIYTHSNIPANDGGISAGQAAVALYKQLIGALEG